MDNNILILMTRLPEVGKAKTRLIPRYGAEGACALHALLTEYALQECLALGLPVHVYFTGGAVQEDAHLLMQDWLGKYAPHNTPLLFVPQETGDLGHKMYAALLHSAGHTARACPHDGARKKLVLIGTDCPDNRRDNLQKAFALLDNHDCVLGPSEDGGYYLVGFAYTEHVQALQIFAKDIHAIFQDIAWSTETVFAQSMEKIHKANMHCALLPTLRDVDEPEHVPCKISVIIPTLNEEKNLAHLLSTMPGAFHTEIIVADAHSTDATLTVAQAHGVHRILSPHKDTYTRGRASQMAAAVAHATGDILLFLHADSILPPQWDKAIRTAMSEPTISLGYFRFAIQEPFWTRPFIEWGTYLRCALFRLPYGDQGLFVRKADFERWNLPQVPILEDVFLVKKARQCGRLYPVPKKLLTSGRRWFQHGFMRTSLINACVLLSARLGMPLEDIKTAYWKGENPLFNHIKTRFLTRTHQKEKR